MWNALEGTMANAGSGSIGQSGNPASAAIDPGTFWMNTQLASALSLTGDAQYWEETISPNTIRQSLAEADPSNPSSTSNTLRGMKWLLASISKGRNVSDFYPHVVKLVGAVSLEVRKMVYMYLDQYANHDATTRELSLLSINAFQRGLADPEQWIRALALRVLTSIQIPDILQIQILGVQKCAQDNSPYVRKCAANALAKLHPRCRPEGIDSSTDDLAQQQQDLLLQICNDLLLHDQATMVLTSALIAWRELCPDKLEMLHGCFRKFCHLLTDMDEWGQVVVIDTFARYCRKYFAEPAGWRDGSAERIDRERRVRRTIYGLENEQHANTTSTSTKAPTNTTANTLMLSTADQAALAGVALPPRNRNSHNTSRRPVVRKGFYSDEEDEADADDKGGGIGIPIGQPLPALQQRNIMGVPISSNEKSSLGAGSLGTATFRDTSSPALASSSQQQTSNLVQADSPEDLDLAPDHRLFLNAAMHLLKSRNAGVVLSVCSLQYYCGVSSIQVRVAMGKALVRIHRDLREIQYVVLASIRTLASECPSAFSPFLPDFFVQDSLDPPFTRLIKLDILTSLALEPAAIDAVLQEMSTYVRHGDVSFARASIRAVGRVVELARIVYDRHAAKSSSNGRTAKKREPRMIANTIALNALHGLLTLTQVPQQSNRAVAGEAVLVMRLILQLLQHDADTIEVEDPNHVQERSIQRILLLLMKTLETRVGLAEEVGVEEDDDSDVEPTTTALDCVVKFDLPEEASALATWVIGEYLAEFTLSPRLQPFRGAGGEGTMRFAIRVEVVRTLVRAFSNLSVAEKEQGVHLASKMIVSRLAGGTTQGFSPAEGPLCEQLLAMGRVDVNTDVRDRARFESALLRSASALQHDLDAMDEDSGATSNNDKKLTLDTVQKLLLAKKPAASSLPLENFSNSHALESDAGFRFGTLSSLLGHQTRSAYIPLPPWAEEDSPSSLRASAEEKRSSDTSNKTTQSSPTNKDQGFYDSSSSEEEDDDDEDDDDSSDDDDEDSSDNDSSDEDSSSSEEEEEDVVAAATSTADFLALQTVASPQPKTMAAPHPPKVQEVVDDDDSTDDDEDEDEMNPAHVPSNTTSSLIPLGNNPQNETMPRTAVEQNGSAPSPTTSSVDDMRGLVLAPVVTHASQDNGTADVERNSSDWIKLVRPEHASGLSVVARYLRGPNKEREAQLLGLKAKPSLVFLQLLLESRASSSQIFRRIKWLPRPLGGSSQVVPKKIYFPSEIDQLKPGQKTECVLGMDFASLSDRDGSMLAKFDFRFGSGSIPVEIKPTLGDMLLPFQPSSRTTGQFDDEVKGLQGFHRVACTIGVKNTTPQDNDLQERTILKAAALTSLSNEGGVLRLMGVLPASGDLIYVRVNRADDTKIQVIVCSENALAANSLMNILKKSIQSNL